MDSRRLGDGGACLPKDTAAFYEFGHEVLGLELPVLWGTMRANELIANGTSAPASMHEVVPTEVLIAEAKETAVHASLVADSGALASEFIDVAEPAEGKIVPIDLNAMADVLLNEAV